MIAEKLRYYLVVIGSHRYTPGMSRVGVDGTQEYHDQHDGHELDWLNLVSLLPRTATENHSWVATDLRPEGHYATALKRTGIYELPPTVPVQLRRYAPPGPRR